MYPNNNYNYYPQQQSQYQSSAPNPYLRPASSYPSVMPGLKGRPVSSLEEARATAIDFDGSIFYFPDLANRCVYTKQINMDGTATLNMYQLVEVPTQPSTPPAEPAAACSIPIGDFVTKEELASILTQLKADLSTVPVKAEIKTSGGVNL